MDELDLLHAYCCPVAAKSDISQGWKSSGLSLSAYVHGCLASWCLTKGQAS